MKEVEVKIEIVDIEQIKKVLAGQDCIFSQPIIQQDVVYIPNEVPTVPCPAGTNVLRIRKQGEKSFFTLKSSDKENHLSKLEHELEILNPEEMEKIIFLLGFKKVCDTTKVRQKCKIQNYEICLDKVEDLGNFLEIEEITEKDPKQIQAEMLLFLSNLNIDTSKRVMVGYDVLWVQKYGKM
jgi:adenylate cyclase class 2